MAHKSYKKGSITWIGWDIFDDYANTHRVGERDLLRRVLDHLERIPSAVWKAPFAWSN